MIGASGFLGSRLLALAPRDMDLVGTGQRRPVREGPWRQRVLDVTSASAVRALVQAERPEAVFYVAYHKSDPAITVDGARVAAMAAAKAHARFVFTSTDLVFDGRTGRYAEDAPLGPTMTYGALKVEAEAHVRDAHPQAIIVRPALMAGESGSMLRPAYECGTLERGEPVDLFTDEWRTPVHVDDVARACWELAARDIAGVFHIGGPQRLSRFELGEVLCRVHGFDRALLRPAPRPPGRPRDTSLDSSRITAFLDWAPRPVEDALVLWLDELPPRAT